MDAKVKNRLLAFKAAAQATISSGKISDVPDSEGISPRKRLEWIAPSVEYIIRQGENVENIDVYVKGLEDPELIANAVYTATGNEYVAEGAYNIRRASEIMNGAKAGAKSSAKTDAKTSAKTDAKTSAKTDAKTSDDNGKSVMEMVKDSFGKVRVKVKKEKEKKVKASKDADEAIKNLAAAKAEADARAEKAERLVLEKNLKISQLQSEIHELLARAEKAEAEVSALRKKCGC